MTVRRRTVVLAVVVFVASVVVTTVIGTLINAAASGQQAADRARDQAQAQASIVAGQRAAQTRRIDLLRAEVDGLQDTAREQAALIGRQEQAIRDLAAQVSHGGQEPVTMGVAPRRTATRTPAPTSGTKPTTRLTTAPKASTQPAKAPTSPQNDGLLCSLLFLVC